MKKSIFTLSALFLACFCWQANAQFFEGFENGIPGSWTVINNGGALSWSTLYDNSGIAYEGNYVAYSPHDAAGIDDYLISPQIMVVTGLTDYYSFYAMSSLSKNFNVLVSTTGTSLSDFTLIGGPFSPPSLWQEYAFDLTPYMGQNIYIAIQTNSSLGSPVVDAVTLGGIPNCPKPSDQTATNITTTTAVLGWIENGTATSWDIELRLNGLPLLGVPTYYGVTNPYMVNGLAPDTRYYYYVRANCGSGVKSTWAGPFFFKTPCNPFAQLAESFLNVAYNETPNCWNEHTSTTSTSTFFGVTTTASDAHSPPNSLEIANSDDKDAVMHLVTPVLPDIPLNTNWLRFVAQASVDGHLEIGTMTDPTDVATYTPIKTIPITGDYREYTHIFNSSITDTHIAFKATFGSTFEIVHLDDIIWEVTPNCLPPSGLTAGGITHNSADLGWVENGPALEWEIEHGSPGFVPGAGTVLIDNDGAPGETITGLAPFSDYEFYVTALCGPGDESLRVGPFAFKTICADFVPDFTEDFSTFVPDCWEEATSGTPAMGVPGYGPGLWGGDYFLNKTINDRAARINLYTNSSEEWFISGYIDLSGGPFELAYTAAVTDFNNSNPPEGTGMGSDDEVQVLLTQDNGVTWANLKTHNQSDFPSPTGDLEIIDLSGYTGRAKIAFWATDGAVDHPEDYDFFIDNVSVRTPAGCLEPTGLAVANITVNSAQLIWTENNSPPATEWFIEYGVEGTTGPGITITDNDGVPGESIFGLQGGTEYYFYVNAICGPGNASVVSGPRNLGTPPSNDDLANAIPLTLGAPCTGDAYTNMLSTVQTGEPTGSCWSGSNVSTSVWFSFTAPASGHVRISTDILPGDMTDSQIAVYPPPTDVNDLSTLPAAIGCDDDDGQFINLMSLLGLTGLSAGTTYYIQVNGYNGTRGDFCIIVNEGPDYVFESSWYPTSPDGVSTATDDVLIVTSGSVLYSDTQMNNLTILPSGNLYVNRVLTINGDLVNNGNMTFWNGPAKFLGQLDDMTGSNITGNGTFSVELHIPARDDSKPAYRFFTSAVNSTESIHENWQEGATDIVPNPWPSNGMFITGSPTGANGFDATPAGAPSMFTFDEATQTYVPIPNTDVDQLVAGQDYVAYVWGDRSVDIINSNNPVATSTTLRSTGNIITGDQSFPGSSFAGDYNLFGNPYQAIVDMNDALSNAGSVNLNTNFIWVWDPNLGTSGAYATVSLPSGAPTPSTSDANQFLMPGQAVWVETTIAALSSIFFGENDKDVSQTPTDVFKPQNLASIELQLFQANRFANRQSLSDALRINFSAGESNAVLPNDAPKLGNFDENLALVNGTELLAIENRALPTDGEVLQLHNDQYRVSDYVYKAISGNMPNNVVVYLIDAYLGTQTLLDNNGATLVSFSVDASIPASIAPDRFSLSCAVNSLSNEDVLGKGGFALYPNPAKNGGFSILSSGIAGEEVQVALYNILGQAVLQTAQTVGADDRILVKTHNLQAGTYIVKMEHNGESFIQKLIVQ